MQTSGKQNLARGKPATQSSISSWSNGPDAASDAAVAVSGVLEQAAFFHTASEDDPWWEVDLGAPCDVSAVVLHNRDAEQQRVANFTLLIADEAGRWQAVFRKCDPQIFSRFEIPLDPPTRARRVRIRLDGHDCLHLRQVEVFGAPAAGPAPRVAAAPAGGVTFSVLYNEDPSFLAPLIDNYLAFTDETTRFVFNLPASFPELPDGLPASPRVRFLRAPNDRQPFGHTLLLGHLQTLHALAQLPEQSAYFAPLASNCLFIRPFRLEEAVARIGVAEPPRWHVPRARLERTDDGISLDGEGWHYPRIARQQPLLAFLLDDLGAQEVCPMQIEGLLAPTACWQALAQHAERLIAAGETVPVSAVIPLEEVIPGTFFNTAFLGQTTHMCQVLWRPFRSRIAMPHVLQPDWAFPRHIAAVKWFERDVRDPQTAAVATPHGRDLLAAVSEMLRRDDPAELDAYAALLETAAQASRALAAERRSQLGDERRSAESS